jgi:uncharacterized protein (TIGR03437 family)
MPSRITGIYRAPATGFQVSAGWPATVEVELVDDCGNPVTEARVVSSFSNGDLPTPLTHYSRGRWIGSWRTRSVRQGTVITTNAETFEPRIAGELRITGAVGAGGELPEIDVGGITDRASLASGLPVAAGSQIRIRGSRLNANAMTADAYPLPGELGGTSALIAGVVAPALAVSPTAMDAVMPFGIATDTPQRLIIKRGTALSVPEDLILTTARPGIFTIADVGSGAADAYIEQDGDLIRPTDRRPARSRDIIRVRVTGLGTADPFVTAGHAAGSDPISRSVAAVRVQVAGRDCQVLDAYLVPGQAGVYEVRAVLADGMTNDSSAPITVAVGEWVSAPAMLFTGSALP